MKKINLTIILAAITSFSFSQDPVDWNFTFKKTGEKTGELRLVASVNKPWHMFSQWQPKDAIASPTVIEISKNPLLIVNGKFTESGDKETYKNTQLGVSAFQYQGKVIFVQPVILRSKIKTSISGSVTFQVCNEEQCLPPKTISFKVGIP